MPAPDLGSLIQSLVDAFPRAPIPDATIRLYIRDLADLPPDVLAEAIVEVRRTSTFFPAICELRAACAERMLGLPDEAEALRQLERHVYWRAEYDSCDSCGGSGFQDVEADSLCPDCRGAGEKLSNARPLLHPVVSDALGAVGGPEGYREADEPTVVRGQFLRLYKALRARSVHETQATGIALPAGLSRRALEPAA